MFYEIFYDRLNYVGKKESLKLGYITQAQMDDLKNVKQVRGSLVVREVAGLDTLISYQPPGERKGIPYVLVVKPASEEPTTGIAIKNPLEAIEEIFGEIPVSRVGAMFSVIRSNIGMAGPVAASIKAGCAPPSIDPR